MNDKIWFEMVDMKYGETYLTLYLGLQRTLKKTFNILTLLLSVSGILGWKYFEKNNYSAFLFMSLISPIAKKPMITMAMIIQAHTKKGVCQNAFPVSGCVE